MPAPEKFQIKERKCLCTYATVILMAMPFNNQGCGTWWGRLEPIEQGPLNCLQVGPYPKR